MIFFQKSCDFLKFAVAALDWTKVIFYLSSKSPMTIPYPKMSEIGEGELHGVTVL